MSYFLQSGIMDSSEMTASVFIGNRLDLLSRSIPIKHISVISGRFQTARKRSNFNLGAFQVFDGIPVQDLRIRTREANPCHLVEFAVALVHAFDGEVVH